MLKTISKTNWVIIFFGIIPALGWFSYGTYILSIFPPKWWGAWPLLLLYLGAILGTIGLLMSLKTAGLTKKSKWLNTMLLVIGILAMTCVLVVFNVYQASALLGLSMISPILVGVFVILKKHGLISNQARKTWK